MKPLTALRELLAEFDRYDRAMTEFGHGHEDYGGQRENARRVIAAARTVTTSRERCDCGALLDWPIHAQTGDPCGTDGVCVKCGARYTAGGSIFDDAPSSPTDSAISLGPNPILH